MPACSPPPPLVVNLTQVSPIAASCTSSDDPRVSCDGTLDLTSTNCPVDITVNAPSNTSFYLPISPPGRYYSCIIFSDKPNSAPRPPQKHNVPTRGENQFSDISGCTTSQVKFTYGNHSDCGVHAGAPNCPTSAYGFFIKGSSFQGAYDPNINNGGNPS